VQYTQISTSYFYYRRFLPNDAVHSDFLRRVWHGVEFVVGLAKGISSGILFYAAPCISLGFTYVEWTRWWRHCRCVRTSVQSTIWSHIVDVRATPLRHRSPHL